MGKIVAIVGRPNVGKSTLFNRLIEANQAIVAEVSGVTRDRHYGKSFWNGKTFSVIDTGGLVEGSEDIFEGEIRRQVKMAIEEADVVLFMVDVKDGLTAADEDIAALLRQVEKKILLVANKADNIARAHDYMEFYSLGFGDIYSISAINGSGTGELLDALVEDFPNETEEESVLPRLAVVGRPNVGKSSFINALVGNDRNIVTDIAGTTRDSINTRYNLFGFDFEIVDTAGLRKKNKVSENIEFYSTVRSIRTIEQSDVCILILDAVQGIENQDVNIFSLVHRNNKGIVVVVNKWDLVEKESNTHKSYEEAIRQRIAPFTDVPVIFTSVLNKQRIYKVLETAREVYENRTRKISTSKLNEEFLPIVKEQNPPPMHKGKRIKIKYIMQLKTAYPQFVFYCNLPQYIREPYKRFVENKLREMYSFNGVPIDIYFRSK